MKDFESFEKEVSSFLSTRGIEDNEDFDKIVRDFHEKVKLILYYYSDKYKIPYRETLEDMANPENLIDSEILHTNYSKPWEELIHNLMKNPLFVKILDASLAHSGKGVGVGELTLPLVVNDYRYSNDSDGTWGSFGYMVELKNGNGASLKTNKSANLRHADDLNKKYFNGNAFGYKNPTKFEKHLDEVDNHPNGPDIYYEYFSEMYPNEDTKALAKKVIDNYKDKDEVRMIMGEFAISTYKSIDAWHNLVIVSAKKGLMVNICDPTNIRSLGLSFDPKMIRGGDTNALGDGYVNVKIA